MESEANEVHEKIIEMKSLAADLCTYCTQDCRDRLKILDSQIEALRGVINELTGEVETLRRGIVELRALYKINLRVLNIVNAPEKAEA